MSVNKEYSIVSLARIRPFNSREKNCEPYLRVFGNEILAQINEKNEPKRFRFDQVFNMLDSQRNFYNMAISPILCELMLGFNCTIFAYGQTNSGKTHTMIGDLDTSNIHYDDDSNAGIVPRALSEIFLKLNGKNSYVSVSFLEIYNETMTDLLAIDKKPLRIYEDASRKGCVQVLNLNQVPVKTMDDAFRVLKTGVQRKNMAATHLNQQSSRSHTIFTINVKIKNYYKDGETLSTAKLSLVDLAGSENAKRSGAVNLRAQEANNINQSLLTLGQVIRNLLKNSPFIPYRQSKLTRILQDSLGGNSKTTFIATVSPDPKTFYESLNTLDYANKAQGIVNKPLTNQLVQIQSEIKTFETRIVSMRKALAAFESGEGTYLALNNYNQIIKDDEENKKKLLENVAQYADLEAKMLDLECQVADLEAVSSNKSKELENLKSLLSAFKKNLEKLQKQREIDNQLIDKYYEAQTELEANTEALSEELGKCILRHNALRSNVDGLYNMANKKKAIYTQINQRQQLLNNEFIEKLQGIEKQVLDLIKSACIENKSNCEAQLQAVMMWRQMLSTLIASLQEKVKDCNNAGENLHKNYIETCLEALQLMHSNAEVAKKQLEETTNRIKDDLKPVDENVSSTLHKDFHVLCSTLGDKMLGTVEGYKDFSSGVIDFVQNNIDSVIAYVKEELHSQVEQDAQNKLKFKQLLLEKMALYRAKREADSLMIKDCLISSRQQLKNECESFYSQQKTLLDKFSQSMCEINEDATRMMENVKRQDNSPHAELKNINEEFSNVLDKNQSVQQECTSQFLGACSRDLQERNQRFDEELSQIKTLQEISVEKFKASKRPTNDEFVYNLQSHCDVAFEKTRETIATQEELVLNKIQVEKLKSSNNIQILDNYKQTTNVEDLIGD